MKNIRFALLSILVLTAPTMAEKRPEVDLVLPQCAELIQGCFMQAAEKRNDCFFSNSQHPFCKGTPLSKLAYKRWAMSPNGVGSTNQPPAFLGPQLVNKECVDKFDNQLSGRLVEGGLTTKSIESLSKMLDGCKREISNELSRP